MKVSIGIVKFKKYKKRRGNEKWKWIFWGPENAAGKRERQASSDKYYTSRANALRNWKKHLIDAHYATIDLTSK